MKVIVDDASSERICGWAFDEDDIERRLTVQVISDGRCIGACRAELYRPDLLANGVGDGRYGFEIPITSDDVYVLADYPIEAFAIDGGGGRVAATLVVDQNLSDGLNSIRGRVVPKFIGPSFLFDNLRAFNPRALTTAHGGGSHELRGFFMVRMYVFGDSMWWDGARHEGAATAARYFEWLGPKTRDAITAGRAMMMFDMSNEGAAARGNAAWLSLLHDELDRQKIAASACVLLTQNRAFGFDYRLWCVEAGRTAHMHVLHYDYYVARVAYLLEAGALPPPASLPAATSDWRHFVCLNFTPREPRTSFVSWLHGAGLEAYGFVSFYGFDNYKESVSREDVPDWFPEAEAASRGRAMLRERGRISLDLPAEGEVFAAPEFDLGPIECYARAFFTIVTETDFFGAEIDRISEKVIKPLALGHPILVVGNPGSLALLRDFGFRTFHPLIDESYDLVDDRAERMRRLQREAARLCALSHTELVAMHEALAETIEHNRLHARRGLAVRFRKKIEPALLTRLADLYTTVATLTPVSRTSVSAETQPDASLEPTDDSCRS